MVGIDGFGSSASIRTIPPLAPTQKPQNVTTARPVAALSLQNHIETMREPMSEVKPKPKPRPKQPAIYFTVREVVDPASGKRIGALVPTTDADRSMMRERAFRRNARVRAALTQPRNEKFNRLVHGLGKVLAQNLDRFTGKQAHAAVKALQLESGVYCVECDIDASPLIDAVLGAAESILGRAAASMLRVVLPSIKTVKLMEAQSLSFDSMGEEVFQDFWSKVCAYLVGNDWPTLTEEQITTMVEIEAFKEPV